MRVHVFGNVAVDETFRVKSVPEPGESVLAHARSRDLGGKGANQAIVAARAGAVVRLIAVVGNDEAGTWAREALAAEGIPLDGLQVRPGSTDVSVVIVGDDAENMIVTTKDAATSLSVAAIEAHLAQAREGDLVLLQGNLKATVTGHVLRYAQQQGLRTLFNPSPLDQEFGQLLPLVNVVVLNQSEALQLTHTNDITAAREALLELGASQAIITLGSAGAVLIDQTGSQSCPAVLVTPVDTTGAGDTFSGVLGAGIARFGRIEVNAVKAAVEAAALTVTRPGARSALPSREELVSILARYALL